MNFNSLKAICMVGCIVPSYSIFTGLIGASPLGVLLTPLFLRKLSISLLIFFIFFIFTSFLQFKSAIDLFNASLLIAPVFIYLLFNQFKTIAMYKFVLDMLLVIFLIEAVIGGLFFSDTIRSASFITQEPSHSARAFFVTVFLRSICLENKRQFNYLIIISVIFIATNKSLSSIVMLLPLLLSNLRIALKASIFLILIFSIGLTPERLNIIKSGVENIPQIDDSQTLVEVASIGSRRLVQSLSAYENSKLIGGVGAGRGNIELVKDSIDSTFSLKSIENRLRSDSVNIGPSSYFSQMSYEYGILITLLLFWCISITRNLSFNGWLWFMSSIGQLLFFSTTLMPTPWIILGVLSGLQKGNVIYPNFSREIYPLTKNNRRA